MWNKIHILYVFTHARARARAHTHTHTHTNYLDNCTRSHLSIYCNPIPTPIILNRRNPQPSNNAKKSRTPMVLKLWILRLYKTRIWFIYSTTRRLASQYIPSTRYRQPNRTTHKLANSNNRNSSRRATLVNSAAAWGKNRCHTRPIKSSKMLSQPTRPPIWTMLRNLWTQLCVCVCVCDKYWHS